MPRIELSNESRKDPTHTLWILDEFEKKITKLFEKAKPKLTDLIPREIIYEHRAIQKASVDLEKVLPQVDQIIETDILDPANNMIEVEIPKAYNAGNAFASIQLGASPEERRAEWTKIGDRIIKTLSDFKGITDETAKTIRATIAEGIINERTFGEITRDIVRNVDGVGIVRSTAMVRTETMKAVNAGVEDEYRKEGVTEVEWLTVLDDRECEECNDLNGEIFPIDDHPDCPLHVNCRCTLLPKIEIPEM